MAQSHRVLIVEDDPDMQDVESQVLGYAGYGVVQARNGLEALTALREQQFSVILLDLMMPVMDGITFLSERRRLRLGENTPVVCLSAATAEILKQALRLGANECLQKPPDFDQLCQRVEYYCTRG